MLLYSWIIFFYAPRVHYILVEGEKTEQKKTSENVKLWQSQIMFTVIQLMALKVDVKIDKKLKIILKEMKKKYSFASS